MSVMATIRVSTRPSRTMAVSSWSRGWSGPPWCDPWSPWLRLRTGPALGEGRAAGVVDRRRSGTLGCPVVGPSGAGDLPGGRLEFLLEIAQVLLRALDLRTLEVRTGPRHVVDGQQDDGAHH